MRVPCTVEQTELDGTDGPIDGVIVTCSRCEAQTESFGTSPASIKRCFALLHEQCDENNFYHDEDEP